MNKFQFLGNITKEIELKELESTKIATVNIAVQRRFKNANGEYESDFFRVTVFGNQAEFVSKYFKKGNKVLFVGHIQNRKYELNGETRYTTDYVAEEVYFGGSRQAETKVDDYIAIDDNAELPF